MDAPGDAERRVALRRMRAMATGLLVLAAVLYLVTLRESRTGWLGWVNAGSEAAMVGALADWFAVTAIFRHPLGIPVPHTALVKRRKNELGRSLQQFVTNNFLTVDVLQERVREAHLVDRAVDWLERPDNRRRLLAQAVRGGKAALLRVKDEDVEALVQATVLPRLRSQPVSPTLGRLLADVVREGSHQQLVDVLARELHSWLQRHPEAARSVIGERAPKWSPGWLDRQVVDFGYNQALEWAMAVRMQPRHPFRQAIDGYLAKLAEDLQGDEKIMARAEALKEQLLHNPSVPGAVVDVWHTVRDSMDQALDDQDSALWRQADRWLAELAQRLRTDPDLHRRAEQRVDDAVVFLVDTYGEELATVISVTVDRWDADEASQRIELFVGRDLQFIRINGTVVGCLAGLVIHAVSQLVH
ncbi:DUF445 domain-containing protein [Luteococcus peritonei]